MKTRFPVLISALFILNFFSVFGQDTPPENPMYGQDKKESSPLKDRFFFGGSLGLQFGSATYIDISPLVGYKITEKLHGGVGATYIYYKEKAYNYAYETSIYGGRVFGRYYILDNLFAHTEFEILNMDVPAGYNPSTGYYEEFVRENVTSLMVGGGYNQMIGTNAALQLMILWNLTEEQYSPYLNPIFRIGFVAGF